MSPTEYKSSSANGLFSHSWDEKESKYRIVESSVEKVNTLDEYVFVVRARIGAYILSSAHSSSAYKDI